MVIVTKESQWQDQLWRIITKNKINFIVIEYNIIGKKMCIKSWLLLLQKLIGFNGLRKFNRSWSMRRKGRMHTIKLEEDTMALITLIFHDTFIFQNISIIGNWGRRLIGPLKIDLTWIYVLFFFWFFWFFGLKNFVSLSLQYLHLQFFMKSWVSVFWKFLWRFVVFWQFSNTIGNVIVSHSRLW